MPGFGMSLRVSLTTAVRLMLGEYSGDIPMYSLHRIKNLLRKVPLDISVELHQILIRNLIKANAEYKEDSGNDWACLTSNNLVDALTETEGAIDQTIELSRMVPAEQSRVSDVVTEKLQQKAADTKKLIRDWFDINSEKLHYDMSGNVPWVVVRRLRQDLTIWVSGAANPFDQDVEDFIIDVAKQDGINAENAESAWTQMGGTIFKN